jgi:hypothetical protein
VAISGDHHEAGKRTPVRYRRTQVEPIYEADLPPEQYAYRPGRSAQQAVVKVEEVLDRNHPDA